MEYFIPFIIIVGLVWLRVVYINALFSDWNYYLDIYILRLTNNPAHGAGSNLLPYLKKKRLKGWKYYWRLDIWNIDKIINDPFLSQEIHHEIQSRYQ